jgi:hypothetical protein
MIDPMLSLALSVHANKGVFALLLGSGISRSAGILTGWEIILDLTRKLAHLQGENCESDPAAWYEKTFNETPDYAKLLEDIGKSQAERSQLLRSYFEPNAEEREQRLKLPTDAHKAIAELVAAGYIRVIVTTNFDRLLENALESKGIIPTIISTPDAVTGALPLAHTHCTIIKLHGDYLDLHIKNTQDELKAYDERFNDLLNRVFDEYGLIVCGWSAEWDTALRAAFERCSSRRFTTFWCAKGQTGEAAKKLIDFRRAQILSITGADAFFRELTEKVSALEEFATPHPLSAKVALANLKRYLPDPQQRIRLHDLVIQETEKLYSELTDEQFPIEDFPPGEKRIQEFTNRLRRYEELSVALLSFMIAGCYWGESHQKDLWKNCLERIANPSGSTGTSEVFTQLRSYPALLLLYGAGIASIASEHYDTLFTLFHEVRIKVLQYHHSDSSEEPAILTLHAGKVLDSDLLKQLPDLKGHWNPGSKFLPIVLRESLREYIPDDRRYIKYFDRFEYIFALEYWHLNPVWAPIGNIGMASYETENPIRQEVSLEIHQAGANAPLLQAGFFGGTQEQYQQIRAEYGHFLNSYRQQFPFANLG